MQVTKTNEIKLYFEKLNYFALLGFAFSLNFPQGFLQFVLAIWFVSSFFVLDFKQKISFNQKSNIPLVLILLLVVGRIIVSLIHGDTLSLFSKVFETQLSMTFLPLILLYSVNQFFDINQVLKVFVLGCVLSCVIMVVYFYLYRFNILSQNEIFMDSSQMMNHSFAQDVNLFQQFCTPYFKHRAGIGANLALSIGSLVYLIKKTKEIKVWEKVMMTFSVFLFIVVLYATGSRSGYISLFAISIFGIIYLFSRNKKLLTLAFVLIMAFLFGLSSLKTTRPLFFNEAGSNNYEKLQKTDPRFKIWESAFEIIQQNPAIGVGYSKIKPSLLEKYQKNGLITDFKEHHNSHNQFIQFALESGIWASVVFALILLPFYYNKNILYLSFAFSMTFTVYSLFEDTLILVNGVSIFVFFLSLLMLSQNKTNSLSGKTISVQNLPESLPKQ